MERRFEEFDAEERRKGFQSILWKSDEELTVDERKETYSR